MVFGNNLFVISGHSGTILTSPDGINWTDQPTSMTSALFAIKFGDGVFVASGSWSGNPTPYQIYRSTNGVDWDGVPTERLTDFTDGGAFGNGRFILVNRFFMPSSTDGGQTWGYVSSPPQFVPKWVEHFDGNFVGRATAFTDSWGRRMTG